MAMGARFIIGHGEGDLGAKDRIHEINADASQGILAFLGSASSGLGSASAEELVEDIA